MASEKQETKNMIEHWQHSGSMRQKKKVETPMVIKEEKDRLFE